MSTINISGTTLVEDPSYRYKMPKLIGKVEGRGNGIKTVIVNVTAVAASLTREPAEVTKFFGCELGSQTTYTAETDRAIVNGAHTDVVLQNHLRNYIENFVLCKTCHLPETHYKIKDGLISQKCLACGGKDLVDMTHKLTAFILAQHKKAKELAKAAEKSASKDKKKDKKDKSKKGEEEEGEAAPVKKEKDSSSKKDKEKKSKSGMSKGGSSDNVFGIGAAAEEEEESDSKAADEAIERLKLWLGDNASATVAQTTDELRNIQTMASLRPADRIIIFLGAVCTEAVVSAKQIEAHKDVLAALAATRIQQRHLIAAVEWLCGTRYPSLVKYFPVLLKSLLDEELVDEDTFFEWAADFARNEFSAEQSMMCIDTLEHLKNSAAPFIKWLQEAEEEGEEDSEEGEDEEEEELEGSQDSS